MSGDVVKEFLVSLGLQVEGAAGFDNAVGKATIAVGVLGTAVFAATGLLFGFTKAIADQYDELGDLSNRINISVADIEEFGYVAQLTGSDIATANASLEQFSKTAGDAANNMGRGQKVFEQLGIKVTDANGKVKDTVGLLGEVGDKIKDMERGQQTAILGRLGLDRTLVDALTTDVSGLRDEFKQLYAATGLDANTAAEKAGKFMDALDRLNFVVSTVGKSLAINFMDRFTDALDGLRKMIVDNLPAIMRAIKPVISIILALADVFIALVYRFSQGVGVIIGWISKVIENTNKWVIAIGLVALAWKRFNLAFLATPVGIILGLGVALGLLIDDFLVWKEGGESLIDWSKWQKEIDMATAVLAVFQNALEKWFSVLSGIVDAVGKLFKGDVAGAIDSLKLAFQGLVDFIRAIFEPVLNAIYNQFKGTFDKIIGVINSVIDKAKSAMGWAKDAANSVEDFFTFGAATPQTAPAPTSARNDYTQPLVTPINGRDYAKPSIAAAASAPALTPRPALAPAPATSIAGPQIVNQETNITVDGSKDPQATGRAVAGQQSQVNGDMARNLKGAVR